MYDGKINCKVVNTEGAQDDNMRKIDDIDNQEINLGNTSDDKSINVGENIHDDEDEEEVNDPFLDDDLQFIQMFQEAASHDLENEIGLETSHIAQIPHSPYTRIKNNQQMTIQVQRVLLKNQLC